MDLIADILLCAGALGVAFYCFVLSRRLSRFTDLEKGVGGAVAVLSAQVDDLTRAVNVAQDTRKKTDADLQALTDRADSVARRLELHLASLHDFADASDEGDPTNDPSPSAEPEPSDAPVGAAIRSSTMQPTRSYFSSHRAMSQEVN